jgi:D-glycero-D-manno-heptose 1,7-bisphosphate phosphatase
MLLLFDLDGTLISSYVEAPGRNYHGWVPLPGVRERLAALQGEGHRLGIATNQAGVAFGHVTEAEFRHKLGAVLAALDLPPETPVEVCFAHPRARLARYRDPERVAGRKPSGRMIWRLAERFPADAADGILYVGDREEDAAAAAAGIPFRWAEEFFGAGGEAGAASMGMSATAPQRSSPMEA